MTKLHVILAGENQLVLHGMSLLLESDIFAVAGIVARADVLSQLNAIGERTDLIVWDSSVDLEEDFARWEAIHREFPKNGIVVIMEQNDTTSVNRALAAGVRGLLPRCISIDALRLSLQLIARGENIFTVPVGLAGARQEPPAVPRVLETSKLRVPLSSREAQILERLGAGSPNKVIARELGVAEATVKVHVKSVLRKINVSNRTQAAIWARNHGL